MWVYFFLVLLSTIDIAYSQDEFVPGQLVIRLKEGVNSEDIIDELAEEGMEIVVGTFNFKISSEMRGKLYMLKLILRVKEHSVNWVSHSKEISLFHNQSDIEF